MEHVDQLIDFAIKPYQSLNYSIFRISISVWQLFSFADDCTYPALVRCQSKDRSYNVLPNTPQLCVGNKFLSLCYTHDRKTTISTTNGPEDMVAFR